MNKTAATRAWQSKKKKYMLVRYGRMNALGFFEHNEVEIPKVPKRVVVKTDKGLELGYLVGQLGPYKSGQFRLSNEQVEKYFTNSEIEFSSSSHGKFIRFATADDIGEEKHLKKIAKDEIEYCSELTKELNLPMKIIDAEHIFGGERVIFYFMADSRVDFRQLVKQLAHEYQTRIEMRQIGSRDEAKLLGDFESCGQQCCCQRFLKALKPVNMRMAKMQKATLDPTKISGYCGRLKCCLRYEDKTYTELKKNLPRRGVKVKTKLGEAKVVNTEILTQLVIVELETGEKKTLAVEDIELIPIKKEGKKQQDNTSNNQKANESTENAAPDKQEKTTQ